MAVTTQASPETSWKMKTPNRSFRFILFIWICGVDGGSSSRITRSPLSCCLVMLLAIRDVLLGDVCDQRICGVAIREQRNDGQQNFGYGERGTPVILQNVQTDVSLGIDVAVVDTRAKDDLRRFERILGGEGDLEEEDPALVDGVWWTEDGANPVIDVVPFRTGTAVWWRVDCYLREFSLDSFHCSALFLCGSFCLWLGAFGNSTRSVRCGAGISGRRLRGVRTQSVSAGTG